MAERGSKTMAEKGSKTILHKSFTQSIKRYCLFYQWYSGGNRSAGAIVPWDDAIPTKRSLCQENAVPLVV